VGEGSEGGVDDSVTVTAGQLARKLKEKHTWLQSASKAAAAASPLEVLYLCMYVFMYIHIYLDMHQRPRCMQKRHIICIYVYMHIRRYINV